MPYLWQYKASDGNSQWQSLGESDNEDVENAYCDVNQIGTVLTDTSISSPESLL